MRTRRWRARRYVNDVREIMRTYGLTWKQAQEAYRRAKDKLKYKKRHKVTRKQIVEVARPPVPVEEEKGTTYPAYVRDLIINLNLWRNVFEEDFSENPLIIFDTPWFTDSAKWDADWNRMVDRFLDLGNEEFADPVKHPEYNVMEGNTPRLWRIEEELAFGITTEYIRFIWPIPENWMPVDDLRNLKKI